MRRVVLPLPVHLRVVALPGGDLRLRGVHGVSAAGLRLGGSCGTAGQDGSGLDMTALRRIVG